MILLLSWNRLIEVIKRTTGSLEGGRREGKMPWRGWRDHSGQSWSEGQFATEVHVKAHYTLSLFSSPTFVLFKRPAIPTLRRYQDVTKYTSSTPPPLTRRSQSRNVLAPTGSPFHLITLSILLTFGFVSSTHQWGHRILGLTVIHLASYHTPHFSRDELDGISRTFLQPVLAGLRRTNIQ